MSGSAFRLGVAILALLRIAPALIVLAANGRSVPALPSYRYAQPNGDTYGFYAAAREFISVWPHMSKPLLAVCALLLAGGAGGAAVLWQRLRHAEAIALAAIALGAFVSIGVHEMRPT